jgi:hypothetical protein
MAEIRVANPRERLTFEQLQRRASLASRGDRDAILANPDAISIPVAQVAAGHVFVAEHNEEILGFAPVLDREDGDTERPRRGSDPGASCDGR